MRRISSATAAVIEQLLDAPTKGRYGYEIMSETKLKSGTLYPVLRRLEALGWVESETEAAVDPGRPSRRFYRLTGLGRAEAVSALDARAVRGAMRWA